MNYKITVKRNDQLKDYSFKEFPSGSLGIITEDTCCGDRVGHLALKTHTDTLQFLETGTWASSPTGVYRLRHLNKSDIITITGC